MMAVNFVTLVAMNAAAIGGCTKPWVESVDHLLRARDPQVCSRACFSFYWSVNPLPYALRPKACPLPRATAAVSSVVTPPCHCRQCKSIGSASLIAGPHSQIRGASAGATGGAFNRSDVWSGLEERLEFRSKITLLHSTFQLSMDGESTFRIIH